MIEKPILPLDAQILRLVSLPHANNGSKILCFRKRQQRMQMVRHQQKGIDPPTLRLVIEGR